MIDFLVAYVATFVIVSGAVAFSVRSASVTRGGRHRRRRNQPTWWVQLDRVAPPPDHDAAAEVVAA